MLESCQCARALKGCGLCCIDEDHQLAIAGVSAPAEGAVCHALQVERQVNKGWQPCTRFDYVCCQEVGQLQTLNLGIGSHHRK